MAPLRAGGWAVTIDPSRPEYQVAVDPDTGEPITLTWEQIGAVQRAFAIWSHVVLAETGKSPDMSNAANWMKSCLLGRILTEGKGPLADPPPTSMAAPWYSLFEYDRADISAQWGLYGPTELTSDSSPSLPAGTLVMNVHQSLWPVAETREDGSLVLANPCSGEHWLLRRRTDEDPEVKKGSRLQSDGSWAPIYYDRQDYVLERLEP